jgi:hypothetical protein
MSMRFGGTLDAYVPVKAPMKRNLPIPAAVAAFVLAGLLLGACADPSTDSGSPPPDSPVTSNPSPGNSIPTPTPKRASPRPGLVDVRPVPWEKVDIIDQSTLDVQFYIGVEECYGVDRVEVTYSEDAVTVTIYQGRVPGAGVCIEIAELKVIRVTLDEPLNGRKILDGA